MSYARLGAILLSLSLGLANTLFPNPAAADGPSPRGAPVKEDPAARYFTNTEVVDQSGKPRRFYDDLLRGKKVLVNFAFTSCKGACPTMTANLVKVQKLLGARVGKEIHMITVSVDPENDTPAVLKKYTEQFGVGAGWYFLTGAPENVSTVLGRLGSLVRKPDDHSTVLLIGNPATGHWIKAQATSRPEDIVYAVDHLDDAE